MVRPLAVQLAAALVAAGAEPAAAAQLATDLQAVARRVIALFGTPTGGPALHVDYTALQEQVLREQRLLALCDRLIEMCARLLVSVEQHIRCLVGAPLDQHVTNFCILGTGIRIGEDSMVCLSPAMIRRFCLPALALVNRLGRGKGHVHFCSLPNSRFEHLYTVLAESAEVAVVSTQFGFEYYQQHLEKLRGKLAVESFYGGDAYRYVCEKYGSFRDWANDFVPRYRKESGLVLYCQVSSVEEGRQVWADWQAAHRL